MPSPKMGDPGESGDSGECSSVLRGAPGGDSVPGDCGKGAAFLDGRVHVCLTISICGFRMRNLSDHTRPIGFILYRSTPVGPGRLLAFHARWLPSSSRS